MKKLILGIFTITILLSCSNNDEEITVIEKNYLIFGHFYGECSGEKCIETFKITENNLYEDIIDDYNGQDLTFIKLENETFEQVKDLIHFIPQQLLNENEPIFGCPDCTDGGGIFIQYSENGTIKSWRIDQNKNNIPNYLHGFIDKVNEKIELINN